MDTPNIKTKSLVEKEGVCPLTTRQIIDRVLKFSEHVNKRTFYAYQRVLARRIIESMLNREGAVLTALFSRQSGKSEIVACLGLAVCLILPALHREFPNDDRFRAYREGVRVGIFGPTNRHSGIIYFRMRSRVESRDFTTGILQDPDLNLALAHSRGDSFAFTNGSIVEAFPASPNVLNEGGTYHLMVVDESQKIEGAKIDKELSPMLAHYNGTMVQIGTAFMARCTFKRDIQRNLDTFRNGGPRNHFEFDYEKVIRDRRHTFDETGDKEHLSYEKYIQKELHKLGGNINDASFKMNFRLLWQEANSTALDIEAFKKLGLKTVEADDFDWDNGLPFAGGRIVAGLDVARDGDSTWLTVLQIDTLNPIVDEGTIKDDADEGGIEIEQPGVYYDKAIVGWKVLQGNFEGDYGQYAKLTSFLRRYPKLDVLVVDATGIGDAVWERMAVLLPGVKVIPFRYSTPSKHNLYRWYFQEIGAGRFHFAAGPKTQETPNYMEFIRQHQELVREYRSSYLHVYASDPEDHDDAPDSAALAVWAAKFESDMPVVDLGSDMGPYRSGPARQSGVVAEVDMGGGGFRGSRLARSNRYVRGRR